VAALGLAVLGTLALILLGRITIQILFARGRFDVAAGDLTYRLLAVAALSLPASVAMAVLPRALVTLYDTCTPLITNLTQRGLRVAMLIPLVPTIGIIALPLATVITNTAEARVLGLVLWLRLRGKGAALQTPARADAPSQLR
jgi:putative peptidoglycan lipid II flippase